MVLYVQSNPVIMTMVRWNLIYNIRYSVVPISSPLLTKTLELLSRNNLVYNDTKYSATTEFNRKWQPTGSKYFGLFIYSQSALQVLGNVFTHHQEHLTVFTASDRVHRYCCRLVSRMRWNTVPSHPWHPVQRTTQLCSPPTPSRSNTSRLWQWPHLHWHATRQHFTETADRSGQIWLLH